jgi:hypothetical protein
MRAFRAILALLLIAALPLFGRDWQRCPAVATFDTQEAVYALGDTHGDYKRLVTLLVAGHLMTAAPSSPDQAAWSGGHAILIVTGDMIDKWDHALDVIALMRALTASAASQGGRVVISVGNHEAEFLNDPKSAKTKDFRGELKAAKIKPLDVAAGTDSEGIGKFLLCLPFASRVNDWFFSHAGSTNGRTLTQLIADLQTGFDAGGYKANVLLGDNGLLEARMKPPWWERAGDKPMDSVARLLGYADALGVKHIVFGHQPGGYSFNDGSTREKGTMFQNFHGLVMLIDVGMSRGVDESGKGYSEGALLRIEGQNATELFPDGTQKQLWPAPTAGQ